MDCEITLEPEIAPDRPLIKIMNAVPDTGLDEFTQIEIEIGRGLRTPVSVKTTETFVVIITDADEHEINYVNKTLTVTMQRGKDIGTIELDVGSEVVGALTDHNILFKSPVPLLTNFIIHVQVPEDC